MARLRYNGLSTTLGGSLTNVATSVTFAAALTHSNGTNVPTIVAPDYIPLAILGATGHLSEIVYLTAYTAAGTTGTITRGREGTAGAAHSSGDVVTQAALVSDNDVPPAYTGPTGASYEAFPRVGGGNVTQTPTSGVLYLTPIVLPIGFTVGHIGFAGGGAAATPTHWWFGLYDSSRTQLAVTADQTTTAWAANTTKSLAIATTASGASSSFVTTYTGLYYVGFVMTAGTATTLAAVQVGNALNALTPILCGPSDTAQTTPPAFPHTAIAISAANNLTIYAYVGA